MKTKVLWLNALLLLVLFLPGGGQTTLAASPEALYTTMQHPASPDDHAVALTDPTILAQGSGWTWQNPLPQGNSLNAVWGGGPNVAFTVGDYGTILHYDGNQWQAVDSGTTQQLNGVWGSGGTNAFAVGGGWNQDSGYFGVILHYDGNVWNEMVNGDTPIYEVWGSSANDVFAVGGNDQYGIVLHYDGSTWREMARDIDSPLHGVWGSAANNVFAVGERGSIFHYDGSAWSRVNSGTDAHLYSIWGSSSDNIFVVGGLGRGIILHYDGSIWSKMDTGNAIMFYDVWGHAPNDVFAVGQITDQYWSSVYYVILHYDGHNWREMTSGTVSYLDLNAIWGSDGNNVFAMGDYGTILRYNGSEWREITRVSSQDFSAVWGDSEGNVFAVGSRWKDANIFRYDVNGWHMMNSNSSQGCNGIWGNNSNDVFAACVSGIILHYDGDAWDAVSVGILDLFDIWGNSSSDVFAVGYAGAILYYDGVSWSTMSSNTDAHLYGVWGSGSSNVFAVGGVSGRIPEDDRGVILHYNGSVWTEIHSGANEVFNGVWGSGPDDLFVVGYKGTILHYDGSKWSPMVSGTDVYLNEVWGSGPNAVFAVGYGGTILHYDGNVWHTMNSGTLNKLNGVWGSGPNDIVVVGEGGSILHYGGNTAPALNDIITSSQAVHWIVRISVASDGTQGNDRSGEPSISRDGRYVAFSSLADNLVPNDTNQRKDIFVHDLLTRQTTRVSVSSTGEQAVSGSSQPHISADGRYVTFASTAKNLATTDSNDVEDIFVHDRETGETTRVSISSTGEEGNEKSYAPYISGDGRYVTFVSAASNLVPDDVNSCEPSFSHADGHCPDIFVHDRETGETELVSVNSDGRQVNGESGYHSRPSISDDGRHVAFNRWDVDSPFAFVLDRVWIRDRENRTTTTVSVVEYGGGQHSWQPSISADGLRVAYQSMTNDTISKETNLCRGISGIACPHVYVYDRESGETARVSVDSQGRQGLDGYSDMPRISADGNIVAFSSAASNLVPNDTNNYCDTTGDQQANNSCYDIFIHNLSASTTTRVSVRPDGEEANNNSYTPAVSAQGEYIAFESSADNLVDDDTNETADVFVVSLLSDAPSPPSTPITPTQEPLATTTPETDVPETETPSPTASVEKSVDSEVAPPPLRSLGLVVVAVVVLGLFIAGGVGLFVVKRYMPSRMHLAWLGCGLGIVLVLLMAAVAIALLAFGASERETVDTQVSPTSNIVMSTTMEIDETPADAPATIAPAATLPPITSTPEASPTPELTSTATFLPSPTEAPTATPTATETPTPACPPVTGTFARVWASMQEQLGCARGNAFQGLVAEENFERGIMFWREAFDQARSPVLFNNGTWRFYHHTPFVEGSPDFSCLDDHTPAQCPPTPKRGFGLMWCNIPELRERLGNATDCERGYYATIQTFDKGSILMNDHGTVYILFDDETWQRR